MQRSYLASSVLDLWLTRYENSIHSFCSPLLCLVPSLTQPLIKMNCSDFKELLTLSKISPVDDFKV